MAPAWPPHCRVTTPQMAASVQIYLEFIYLRRTL